MKLDEVPQDNNAMYRGGRKALYACGNEGEYAIIQSSGWSVEEVATLQAVDEFRRLEHEAYELFLNRLSSALEVWMYRRRMSLVTLSQCTGFWQWQVKRHLKPAIFTSLSPKKIELYCAALDVTPEELHHPKEPQ